MPDANGDPVGIEVEHQVWPVVPDDSAVLTGGHFSLKQLNADSHAADLFDAFSLESLGSLWT
jgi:hypothetical protein